MNVSFLNQVIQLFRFQMLKVVKVCLTLHPHSWFVALDQENAYWHPFLAFQIRHGVPQIKVLSFGLNNAAQVLVKMIKPLFKFSFTWTLKYSCIPTTG